jgi:competence protein ComEC
MGGKFAGWLEAERGRFALLLPVGMGAAILGYFALPDEPPLWLGGWLAAAAGVALAAGWRHPVARFVAALALAASLGFVRAEWRTHDAAPLLVVPSGAIGVSGTIEGIDLLPEGRRITLAQPSLDGGPPRRREVRLKLRPDDMAVLAPGARVDAYAMLFGPDRPAYPGAWDAGRDDFFAGIGATGFALGAVTVTAPAGPGALWLQAVRARIAARIFASLPVATGSVAVTLLTGDEQAIPEAERQDFIAAGLAHILAVAGLHVGIVMGLVFFAARWLLTRSEGLALRLPVKPIAAGLALLAGAGYAALTGAHLPILRSLAMASLVTLGVVVGRRAMSLRGLALGAAIIMLVTPEAVTGVSFQMSFSAVLALIAGYEAVRGRFLRRHESGPVRRFGQHVAALAYTSLLAGGASMPFAAYQFQQIQPYWIPANLVVVPLTALWIMPLGLAALALMPLGLSVLALVPMGWGIALIVWLTQQIAAWPDAMLRVAPMPDAAACAFAAGLIWLCIWRSRVRLAGLAGLALGLWLALAARPPDVLVGADARLIAIRSPPVIYVVRAPRASSYTLAAWTPVWGGAPLTQAACTALTCRLGPVLFALGPPLGGCGDAALAVSPEPLRGACGALPVIDRLTVWYDGATEAWVEGGRVRLRTDRGVQGERPWVFPYPQTTTLR